MKYWALILLVAITFNGMASNGDIEQEEKSEKVSFYDTKTFEILHAGTPLIVAGFAFKPACEEFQNIRNSNCGDVRFYADDYLQYAPAGIMLALKAAGVENRSSWGRMITSDALSVAMVSIMVNSVKRTVGVNRPYSNSNTSMPSGHTATAFMAATMLHKEYGGVSPWYSIAGYSIAATSGAMRVINNQHWVSDVMVGAGIGIIATEIGYLLGDLIYKDRGINKDLDPSFNSTWDGISSKASVGFYLGVVSALSQPSETVKINMGAKIGVETSYLINGRFGVGAGASMSNYTMDMDGVLQEQYLDVIAANVGAYYAQPISGRWRVGAKALVGMDYYRECMINDDFDIRKGARAAFGGGATMEYLTNQHWSVKAFCDYNAACIKELSGANLHQTATFGISGNIIF